jgi:hypothetical protein
MLFLLIMEVLNAMFRKADEWALLHQLGARAMPFRSSLYADDVILFVCLDVRDLQLTKLIFDIFHATSGLACNLAKYQIAFIQCMEDLLQAAHDNFPCPNVEFPIRYLGLLLAPGKLPQLVLQPLVGRATDTLPTWKG